MKKEFICTRMQKKLLICFASVDASVVQLGGGTRQAPGRGAGSCIVNTSNTRPGHWRSSHMFRGHLNHIQTQGRYSSNRMVFIF